MTIRKLLVAVLFLFLLSGLACAKEHPDKIQNRCGWFVNPTPANAWLHDRDGEWVVGIQGGHTAEGDWPVFKDQWIRTNGFYGYGCACIKGITNKSTKQFASIISARAQPLTVCRKDRALPARE